MRDVRVVLHQVEIDALTRDPELVGLLLDAAQPAVAGARSRAPHRTGAGAESIRAEAVLDGQEQTVHISWDQAHYYMGFQDMGTSRIPARRFLEDALEALSR